MHTYRIFRFRRVRQKFGCAFFESGDKSLVLGEAVQFLGNFQKLALKLLKKTKSIEKVSEQCKDSRTFSVLFARAMG